MLRRWPVESRGNGYATEVVSLMERQLSCYGGGQLNGGRMVILQSCSL